MRKGLSLTINVFLMVLLTGVFSSVWAKEAPVKKTPVPKKKIERKRSDIRYTGFEAKRDPFAPPIKIAAMLERPDEIPGAEAVAQEVKLPDIDLQGIIWSRIVPQVIINRSVMKAGDFIDDFQIKEIRKTGIVLFYKGNDYLIKMKAYTKPKSFKRKR